MAEKQLSMIPQTKHNDLCNDCQLIERRQLMVDIERLASEKADLFARLQCCEEDLKTANECEISVMTISN